MRPFPQFLKNQAIDVDDSDDYGETTKKRKVAQREQQDAACQTVIGLIQFPQLYNISKSDAPNYVSLRDAALFVKQRPKAQEAQQ